MINKSDLDKIFSKIENVLNNPKSFVSAKFGPKWEEYAKEQIRLGNWTQEHLIYIAARNGRKATILEEELKALSKDV